MGEAPMPRMMIPLFLSLILFNLLFLAATTALGYGVMIGHRDLAAYHQLAGALATLICCGVHCVVFTYFIATAKWVQHAVSLKRLDASLIAPTRSFKAQAFPAALLAMAIVFLTAVVGAATFSYGVRPIIHHALAIASLLVNVACAAVEYRAIARNGALIDRILALVNPPAAPAASTTL
jgi:hypothetical protein